jgi:hypothetical protein
MFQRVTSSAARSASVFGRNVELQICRISGRKVLCAPSLPSPRMYGASCMCKASFTACVHQRASVRTPQTLLAFESAPAE